MKVIWSFVGHGMLPCNDSNIFEVGRVSEHDRNDGNIHIECDFHKSPYDVKYIGTQAGDDGGLINEMLAWHFPRYCNAECYDDCIEWIIDTNTLEILSKAILIMKGQTQLVYVEGHDKRVPGKSSIGSPTEFRNSEAFIMITEFELHKAVNNVIVIKNGTIGFSQTPELTEDFELIEDEDFVGRVECRVLEFIQKHKQPESYHMAVRAAASALFLNLGNKANKDVSIPTKW